MDKHQTFLSKNVLVLWNDDAEGGDSLRLVLMEREAAAAYSLDLAGKGKTDSASFRLRGEERDENMRGYIFGDETGVVAHVDDNGFLVVGIGMEMDKCLLACRGLQIRGAAFLLVPTLIISILLVSFCR